VANCSIRGDRRKQRRYPIALELEYKVMEGCEMVGTGAGTTGNISSGGLLFLTTGILVAGLAVKLSIRWPAESGGPSFIELRMAGRIVRSDANGTALEVCRYHFQKSVTPAPPSMTCLAMP
jgi:PilZ domain